MQKTYINQGLAILLNIFNDLKVKNVFLIVGSNSFESIQNIIKPYIAEKNLETFIVTDSNIQTIISGCEQINKSNSDLVIAIGGGRIIDAAKLISTNAFSNDNYKNIIKGNEIIKNKFLPLLVMPTTAGTGSEATHFSVVYLDEKKYSVASKKLLPEYVIADTSLVQKMPSYLKACTLFDAFSQAIESFWSVNSTASSKEYSKRAIELFLFTAVVGVRRVRSVCSDRTPQTPRTVRAARTGPYSVGLKAISVPLSVVSAMHSSSCLPSRNRSVRSALRSLSLNLSQC